MFRIWYIRPRESHDELMMRELSIVNLATRVKWWVYQAGREEQRSAKPFANSQSHLISYPRRTNLTPTSNQQHHPKNLQELPHIWNTSLRVAHSVLRTDGLSNLSVQWKLYSNWVDEITGTFRDVGTLQHMYDNCCESCDVCWKYKLYWWIANLHKKLLLGLMCRWDLGV